jgi:hypothetical protein
MGPRLPLGTAFRRPASKKRFRLTRRVPLYRQTVTVQSHAAQEIRPAGPFSAHAGAAEFARSAAAARTRRHSRRAGVPFCTTLARSRMRKPTELRIACAAPCRRSYARKAGLPVHFGCHAGYGRRSHYEVDAARPGDGRIPGRQPCIRSDPAFSSGARQTTQHSIEGSGFCCRCRSARGMQHGPDTTRYPVCKRGVRMICVNSRISMQDLQFPQHRCGRNAWPCKALRVVQVRLLQKLNQRHLQSAEQAHVTALRESPNNGCYANRTEARIPQK